MEVKRSWKAMGTSVDVLIYGDQRLATYAKERLDELERKWSRFLPYSEITKLNNNNGEALRVSRDTVLLINRGIEGYKITSGLFDPTILGDLLRVGYSSSFDVIQAKDHKNGSPIPNFSQGLENIKIDSNNFVTIPEEIGFDPGGIGKGLAADIIASELIQKGAEGALINIGGDMRIIGYHDSFEAWNVGIEDIDGRCISFVTLESGAIATSTTKKRKWLHEGKEVHHIINPKTGVNPKTDTTIASVIAAKAWQAEILTKSLFVNKEEGHLLVESLGAQYLLLNAENKITKSTHWDDFELKGALI